MLVLLLIREPNQITGPMWFLIVPMSLGSIIALYQIIEIYKFLKAYINEKCYDSILD